MKKFLWGALVVILAVGGFFGYQRYQTAQAAKSDTYQTVKITRGDLVATTGATGTVHANQTSTLTWQTTGFVDQVNVKLGDTVNVNQVLATLKQSSLPQNIILAQADLVTAQRTLDQLRNSNTATAQAQQALVQAQKAYDDANNHREGMNYPRASQTNLDNARSTYELAQSELARAQAAYDKVSGLPDGDLVKTQALNNLTNAQKARDTARATYNWLNGKPTNQDLSQADAQLAVAEAQLKDAQREWDRLKNGPDPQDISAAEARVSALQATLDLARLQAPIHGTVTDLQMKPGDQVSPTATAIRIDDLSHLLVDVQVPEVDISRIKVGQDVSMTFDAIQGKEYSGKVTQVARVANTLPQTNTLTQATTQNQGVVDFNVTVEITNPDDSVLPGMTAAVNVVVDKVNNVLLVPNRAVRSKDGKRVVYILQENNLQPIEVNLGASNDTMSQVLSTNLHEGDSVVLNPPLEFQSSGRPSFVGR